MRRIKKGSAILLAAALVFSALALPKAYAAVGIEEPENGCSVEFNVPTSTFSELSTLEIPVYFYKVANVGVGGDYTAVTGIDTSLAVIDSDTTADEMKVLADALKTEVETDDISPVKDIVVNNSNKIADGLEIGLYLVIPETVNSSYYEYEFSPMLISLPSNNFYNGGNDSWIYDVEVDLKAEKADRYGDLEINKTLDVYNTTVGGATFVFQVEATKTDVDDKTSTPVSVYSNVVSLTFKGPGTESILIQDLPAGAVVTVTEIYSGAGYTLTSEGTQSVTIVAKEENSEVTADAEPVEVSFSNTYDEGMNGGSGVVNSFSYVDGQWTWQQKKVSDIENAKPNLAPVVSGTQQ